MNGSTVTDFVLLNNLLGFFLCVCVCLCVCNSYDGHEFCYTNSESRIHFHWSLKTYNKQHSHMPRVFKQV